MIWWGLNGIPEKNYIFSLYAKGGFSQEPKPVWSNIIKLPALHSFLWQRMVFIGTHQQCLTLLMDYVTFHMQTFWKLQKQKPWNFLNCWLQTWEYSQGKDHSVIAMFFIHFPQTSVTGHYQKQVILLQILVWPRMTVFMFWLIALIQHHPHNSYKSSYLFFSSYLPEPQEFKENSSFACGEYLQLQQSLSGLAFILL